MTGGVVHPCHGTMGLQPTSCERCPLSGEFPACRIIQTFAFSSSTGGARACAHFCVNILRIFDHEHLKNICANALQAFNTIMERLHGLEGAIESVADDMQLSESSLVRASSQGALPPVAAASAGSVTHSVTSDDFTQQFLTGPATGPATESVAHMMCDVGRVLI